MKGFVENTKIMKKKLEKIMSLQNNHLTNSLTKSIVNLTTKKKKYVFILEDLLLYFLLSRCFPQFQFFSCFFQLDIDSNPNLLLAEFRAADQVSQGSKYGTVVFPGVTQTSEYV